MSGVLGQDAHSLYAGCYRRLVAQVLALTGDLAEARDAVEEAFGRAVAQPRPFARLDDPEAWLRITALTVARRRRRRRERVDRLRGLARRWRTRWFGWFGWVGFTGRTGRDRATAATAVAALPETAPACEPADRQGAATAGHPGDASAESTRPTGSAGSAGSAGSDGSAGSTGSAGSAGSAAQAALPDGFRAALQAFATLPERYREIVALHHLAGLPVHEIASVTGTSTHTVHTRLQYGRQLVAAMPPQEASTGPGDGSGNGASGRSADGSRGTSPVVGPSG